MGHSYRRRRAILPLLLPLIIAWSGLCIVQAASRTGDDNVCQAGDESCASQHQQQQPVGSLRPSHLPQPVVFTDFASNSTVTLPDTGMELEVAIGKVTQINQFSSSTLTTEATEFSVIPQALSRASVDQVLDILNDYQDYDEDPDTVDGMPTYEIFVDSPEVNEKKITNKVRDSDPKFLPDRVKMRDHLQSILQPYLKTVLTPYIQQQYPEVCTQKGADRVCTPCYSLIRRYRHGDRVSHATHHDGQAIVTVVVSLSDYDVDYRGGLYASTGFGQQEYLALNKGDAVVHRSTLLHGVKVYDTLHQPEKTHRWSWIMWYRDSTSCQDHSYEWFAECAHAGNSACQQLHSTKVTQIPGISKEEASKQVLEWNMKAAKGGAGMSAIKIARAYLHQLPSQLPLSIELAAEYFQMAIASHNPDGHYGMAQLLLQQVSYEQQTQQLKVAMDNTEIIQAVQHLEAAAKLGHAYSQFNLGMVHTYGYATGQIDGAVAAEWFAASGLPEGYYIAAQQARAIGNRTRYNECGEMAAKLGFTAPWRKQAREATGSGGAGGVSLNLPWPAAMDGRRPPQV